MRKRRRPNERFTAKQVQHPHWQSDRKAQESRCIQFGRPDQQRNASQERGEMANPYRVLWGAVENVVTGVCGIPGAANYTEPLHWDAGGHIRGIGHLLDARIKRTVRWDGGRGAIGRCSVGLRLAGSRFTWRFHCALAFEEHTFRNADTRRRDVTQ